MKIEDVDKEMVMDGMFKRRKKLEIGEDIEALATEDWKRQLRALAASTRERAVKCGCESCVQAAIDLSSVERATERREAGKDGVIEIWVSEDWERRLEMASLAAAERKRKTKELLLANRYLEAVPTAIPVDGEGLAGWPNARNIPVPAGPAYQLFGEIREEVDRAISIVDDEFERGGPVGRGNPRSDVLPAEESPEVIFTGDDVSILRMFAGANFEPGASVILPSGHRFGGDEMQALIGAPRPLSKPKGKLGVLNTSVLTSDGDFTMKTITLEQARHLVGRAEGIDSAVGHESTAQILTTLLGVEVEMNRQTFTQEPGQSCLVFKLNGRPEPGRELSEKEVQRIGFSFKLLTRVDPGIGNQEN